MNKTAGNLLVFIIIFMEIIG